MIIDNEIKLDYSDVLMVPNRSSLKSRSQVSTTVDFFHRKITPIIAANMDGVGTFAMAEALSKYNMLTALIKHYTIEDLVDFYDNSREAAKYSVYSMGTNQDDMDKFVQFRNVCLDSDIPGPFYLCVDVANGYTTQFEDFCANIAENYPEYVLMAGNVVTPERVEQLFEVGVDVVKVGIGPGSICTTRKITGVGYPQFSAVLECSQVAKTAGGRIIADGGCTNPGDVCKAFAAGADMVMLGGMLAGHAEGLPDENKDRVEFMSNVPFYGMASKAAQELHNGGVSEYRASEGKEVILKYRGPVEKTMQEILGGIRSACTYIGADDIYSMPRKAKFVKVNRVLNNVFGSNS